MVLAFVLYYNPALIFDRNLLSLKININRHPGTTSGGRSGQIEKIPRRWKIFLEILLPKKDDHSDERPF